MIFRYDYVLSIWILAWFCLYKFKIVPYNPILILLIASIIDTIAIFIKIYNNETFNNLFKFFLIQCFIKYIPLYIVWSENIFNSTNIISTTVFMIIYFIYMFINVGNLRNILEIYDKMLRTSTSQNTKDKYPITALLDKFL